MSKIKDLITDVTFTLKSTVQTPVKVGRTVKQVDVYTYECKENKAAVVFHSHPTQAWNWVILPETNDVGKIVASAVIEAFCKAGLHRTRKQSFEDAIKTLQF